MPVMALHDHSNSLSSQPRGPIDHAVYEHISGIGPELGQRE